MDYNSMLNSIKNLSQQKIDAQTHTILSRWSKNDLFLNCKKLGFSTKPPKFSTKPHEF